MRWALWASLTFNRATRGMKPASESKSASASALTRVTSMLHPVDRTCICRTRSIDLR